jgi:heme exporter protein B
MWHIFWQTLLRELLLVVRNRGDLVTILIFFVIVTALFPLAIGPEMSILRTIAGGVVWVAALLASMLALERLFAHDYQDGTLELALTSVWPLSLLVLAKIVAHWLITGLPLVLMAPVVGLQYGLEWPLLQLLFLTLLIGTPGLSAIGAIGAALTLGLRGGGALIALLVLPLVIPILIFGAGTIDAVAGGMSGDGHLYLLAAITLVALFLAPLAAAFALRIAVE